MSQRFLFDEDNQLPAKIIRAVIWSGVMGTLWVFPFVALVLAVALSPFSQVAPGEDDYSGLAFGLIFVGVCACATVAFLAGATVGLLSGFNAHPEEPFFPVRVPLFCSTSKWIGATVFVMLFGAIAAAFFP
jgi:hypothetical protein